MSSTGNAGDLMAQHPMAFDFCSRYVIEAKFWKNLNLIQFLEGEGDLFKAMQKVTQEGIKVNKSWWLVSKQNHRKELLFTSVKKLYPDHLKGSDSPQVHMLFSGTVNMYYLDDFLEKVISERYIQL